MDLITHVKTSVPQPAVKMKRRGPRSRAGFMAAPQLADIDMEIPRTTVPTIGGSNASGAGAFLLSFRGRMHNISMAVPTTYTQTYRRQTTAWSVFISGMIY